MTKNIELFTYWRSSSSWRVRWALNHKNIAYTSTPVNLLKGEQQDPSYLTQNPSGQVPTLKVNGLCITESMAILEWLEETFPQNPLLPVSPSDRAKVRELAYGVTSGIQPIQNLKVLKFAVSKGIDKMEWGKHWIEEGLRPLEKKICQIAGTFAFGGNLSFVDMCLIPQLYNAERFQVNLSAFPTLQRIYQHCLTLPTCLDASPAKQPDALP